MYTLQIRIYVSTHGGDQTLNIWISRSHDFLTIFSEIRLKIFGSRDLTIFSFDLLSDGDSVYTRESSYENLGTPVKACLRCTGNVLEMYVLEMYGKLVENFGSCDYFKF